jgi:hypothetical protein
MLPLGVSSVNRGPNLLSGTIYWTAQSSQNHIHLIVLNGIFCNTICLHLCLFHKLYRDYFFSSYVYFFCLIVLLALLFFHAAFLDIRDYHNKLSVYHLQMFLYKRCN